ncbi:SDR family oxidoreductase [Streptomyces sp. NPDC006332]|uniref:SDR family oxidoreductase n=1 Tax=Streptomyces sp. NPDC006332 TaxID=3155456 RepID=UPI0033B1CF0E
MDRPITVIGGAGRVASLIAQKLLSGGERVRVVGRNERHARKLPEGATFHAADVRDPATLAEPLADCSAVVFSVEPGTADQGADSPKSTMYQGVCNALNAARAGGARPHFALVSQIYVTRHDHPINNWGRMLDWRLAGEDAVRESGLPYTVVRPGWLTDKRSEGDQVHVEQGDRGDGSVSRSDVAEAIVQSLYLPAADGLTFEIFNEQGSARTDWNALFSSLRPGQVSAA